MLVFGKRQRNSSFCLSFFPPTWNNSSSLKLKHLIWKLGQKVSVCGCVGRGILSREKLLEGQDAAPALQGELYWDSLWVKPWRVLLGWTRRWRRQPRKSLNTSNTGAQPPLLLIWELLPAAFSGSEGCPTPRVSSLGAQHPPGQLLALSTWMLCWTPKGLEEKPSLQWGVCASFPIGTPVEDVHH